jgi:hypothetical protein
MQSSPFPSYLIPLRSKYSPQHPILETLSVRSSLNVSDQVSHPYKTASKIIVLIFGNVPKKINSKCKKNKELPNVGASGTHNNHRDLNN